MTLRRSVPVALFLLVVFARLVHGQDAGLNSFVDRFVLDTATVTAADLSPDGKWLVALSGTLRDRVGIDNTRFQDPTYIAPSVSDVWIIDTARAAAQKLFPDKRQVRAFKWSPDASRLAFLARKGDVFEPMLWERATGRVSAITLPAGKEAADNAELEWSPDGADVMLAVRGAEWRGDAKKRFDGETSATVVVHSAKEPFLAWDDVRRMGSIRGLIAHDVRSGKNRDVVPQGRVSSYNLVEDGSTVTYAEDITKKTDYDVIFGLLVDLSAAI